MKFDNTLLLNGADASADIASSPITLESIYVFAVQAVFTGSPVGTIKLQVSCDPGRTTSNAYGTDVANWSDLAGMSASISAAGLVMFNVTDAGYKWVRVVYTAASGIGGLTVRFNAKGV